MRKGINFGRPRANFLRKVQRRRKENLSRQICETKKQMVRSRKAVRIYREFSNTKLIQVWASYWFTITFWALPRKVFRHCHLLACTTVSKWVSYISSRTNLIFFLRRVLSLMVIAVFIKMIFRDSTPAQAWFFFKWSSLADDCCCVYKDDIPWFNSRTSLIFF